MTNCVKTFLADDDGMIQDVGNLSYGPIKANEAFDLMNFVPYYTKIYQKILYLTLPYRNKDEDLTSYRGFNELYYWDSQKRKNKLLDIEDERAQDLLQILLSKKSEERKTIESVLKHPYIDSGKPFMKGILKQNEDNVKYLFSKFTTVVCNAMFQATEIKVPTCFIISEKKLDNNKNGNKNGEKNDHFFKGMCEKLSTAGVHKFMNNPGKFVGEFIAEHMMAKTSKCFYLYLVDEYTKDTIIPEDENGTYPIEVVIEKNEESHQNLIYILPIIAVQMMILFKYNKHVKQLLAGFDKVEKVSNDLNDYVKDQQDEKNQNKMKGHELRSFEKFLLEKDEARDFCKLRRFCDKEGNAIWTLPKNEEKLREEDRVLKRMSIEELIEIKAQLESAKKDKTELKDQLEAEKKDKAELKAQLEAKKINKTENECFSPCCIQ